MIAQSERLEAYLKEFERWVPGDAARRGELRAELEAHLREAEEAGQLEVAIARLGPPRDAARMFAGGRELPPAPRVRRLAAAVIDWTSSAVLALLGLGVGFLFSSASSGIGKVCFSFGGEQMQCSAAKATIALPLMLAALFWYSVGLTLVEWRYGQTPGKRVLSIRVLSEDGTAPSIGQVVIRRLPLLFGGGLQFIDFAFALFGPRYQRGFDRIARTIVVRDR